MIELGRIARVDPRTVWTSEARDFTPWLAASLEKLGELLGLELDLVRSEHRVGDFAIDILARDVGRDRVVVVENQLETTDHCHLGQAITYAAGVEAGVVVWVSPEFREEHRQAIDWLNRGHGTATEFFAVVVEVLRIDGSKPAVNFRLAAAPNEWLRGNRGAADAAGEPTSKQAAYLAFFQRLIDRLRDEHHFTNARTAQPQNWYSFTSGVRGFSYGVSFAAGRRLRADLYIDGGEAEANESEFIRLQSERDAIEREFGESLSWEPLDTKRACRVAAYRGGAIDDSEPQIEGHLEWAIQRLLKLREVFGRRIRPL